MRVTKPMIERGAEVFREAEMLPPHEAAEMVLRAALQDPLPAPSREEIEGEMTLDDFPEVWT